MKGWKRGKCARRKISGSEVVNGNGISCGSNLVSEKTRGEFEDLVGTGIGSARKVGESCRKF